MLPQSNNVETGTSKSLQISSQILLRTMIPRSVYVAIDLHVCASAGTLVFIFYYPDSKL